MNRTIIPLTATLGALTPLLFDSALKGAVLLAVAALGTLMLWRASAAARHLVWLVAVVALLIVPVLSVALPQWRVLPRWAAGPKAEQRTAGTQGTQMTEGTALTPALPGATAMPQASSRAWEAAGAGAPAVPSVPSVPSVPAVSMFPPWLVAAWAAGFMVLVLRLLAAHFLLSRAARKSLTLAVQPPSGTQSRAKGQEAVEATLEAACAQLGIRQRVILLFDEKRTIPVVWGVFRPHLMLPAEAREWGDGQLRSVLLHELAHIRRRDTLVQWLTQIACALHWWNPLVWLAAWRLHVERERACDDLVLASGVRPSAYAEHLLHVATKLSPARWTSACGLAMARQSSLEGRLLAVLSENLNRRGVTSALAAIALILGAGIAIPVAMLRAADEKPIARIQPATEAKLKWGEPVNGLRMALAWPPTLGEPAMGDAKEFFLVVQNVSETAVRIAAGDDAPNPRRLMMRENGRPLQAISDPVPTPGDWLLQPREVVFLRLYQSNANWKDGRTVSSAIEQDIRTVPRYSMTAEMTIEKAPAGAWTGKLITGQTRGSADVADAPAPKHKDARALYEVWQRHARQNGNIPGALIGELAAAVRTFIGYNPTWETVPKLNALLPRIDATRDWTAADVIALLDELAAVQDSPLMTAAEKATRHTIRKGEPLPAKFANAPWGDAEPNGLRAAWVLEPGAAEHRMGTALGARLLVHNPGQVPVVLQVPTWHQGWVKASDAKGAEVEVSGISWTTLAQLFPVRLAPGEYVAINTPGIGFGPRAGMGPWAGPRVGSNVLAKPGDELTLTHGLVPLDGSEVGVREDDPHVVGPGWWLAHIKARLNRELPLPADAAERTRLLDRAVRELFATAPTAEETATFVADQTPGALDALVKRLAGRTDIMSFSGKLQTAPARFRVLAADANADKQPRVVLGPGEYPLSTATLKSGAATLKIVGRPVGDRRTNDAQLLFEAVEATGILPPQPHKLGVPDGWGNWAIVCRPSEGFFYLLHNGAVRKIDYSTPRKVTDTPANDLPAEFRDEVKRQLDIHGVSDTQQAEVFEKPAPPATTPAPKTAANVPASDEAPLKPKHEYAQSLFRKWQANARTDGKIPGALIGHVAREVEGFLRQYPEDEKTPKLAALRPRLDASRDWEQAEVVALLDDITAISTAPVSWADIPMEFSAMRAIQGGEALPIELTSAAWGQPMANGLRAAWLLDPRAEQYPLGSVLKARVLFHNTGKAPVVFRTETWHQSDPHTARDAKGAEIKVGSTWYSGITPVATFRLAPHEYCEVKGHGIAIGAGEYTEEHSTGTVGAVIEAKEGDEVSLSHSVDTTYGGWSRPDDPKDPAELWKATIAERVANEAPVPRVAADREQLIRRVTRDIFGEPPSAEEIAAFTADDAPGALAHLTARLQARQRVEPFSGKLPTGETKFRVIAADPDAAKAPRTANAPGRYVLGDSAHLLVSQLTEGDKRTNKATIAFLSSDPKVASPHKPHEFALPDGIGTYAIVWDRGAGALWVMQKGLVRKYEFANPAQVQEMRIEPGNILSIPAHLQEPLKKAFKVAGTTAEAVKAPAKPQPENPDQTANVDWAKAFEEVGGLDYNPGKPFDAEPLFRLSADPMKHSRRLSWLIAHAGALKDKRFQFLLENGELRKDRGLALALSAYDYSVNGNRAGLDYVLNELAKAKPGSDDQAAVPLGFIDEWEKTIAAFEKHFARADGAAAIAAGAFWMERQCLFPRQFERFRRGRLEFSKLEPQSLRGRWAGEKDGVNVELRFDGSQSRRAQWLVRRGDKVIDTALSADVMPDGRSVTLQTRRESLGWVPCGRLKPGEAGALRLDIWQDVSEKQPGYPRVTDLVLTKQADTAVPPERTGIMLKPENEARFQWGAVVGGLRMALARPQAVGEKETEEVFDLRLVVQNASDDQVRFSTAAVAKQMPHLKVRKDGRTLMAFTFEKPEVAETLLHPREAVVLRMSPKPVAGPSITRDDPTTTFVAELEIDATEGAWSGKLVSAETSATLTAHGLMPKHKDAQALFKTWTTAARRDGQIPGALIGLLAGSVSTFIKSNPTWETTPQLASMLPRFDSSHDWTGADAVALLDELAAVQDTPLSMALDRERELTIVTGGPLPPELADAPWGEALTNGLRLAYVLEPRATEHRLNTPLQGRILIHNAGNEPVAFRTRGWHQPEHSARDAEGADISVEATSWLTRGVLAPYRLAPGEFVELHTTGIGVGANKNPDDWQNTRVGSWLDVKAGDEVTVTTGGVPLSDWNEEGNGPGWWLDHITARLSRHLPFPADKAARELLLYRVAMELFGNPVNESVNAAFVADTTPGALDALAERLARREGVVPFTVTPFVGALKPATTKFRVLPADPDAAKRPRTANNPGRYTLGDLVRFVVTRRPDGERIVNEADITFYPPGKENVLNKVTLPDGYDTWAAAWVKDTTTLWVTQKGLLRRFDFTNPAKVEETRYEADKAAEAPIPAHIREALRAALAVPDAPKQIQQPLK